MHVCPQAICHNMALCSNLFLVANTHTHTYTPSPNMSPLMSEYTEKEKHADFKKLDTHARAHTHTPIPRDVVQELLLNLNPL